MNGGLWRPVSDCATGCLPGPDGAPVAAPARRVGRAVGLLGVLALTAVLLPVLPLLPRRAGAAVVRRAARTVTAALGIRLTVRGRLPRRGALLVANHVSWLDVVALLALTPARLLAKREVRRWPLVGAVAACAGTIFLDRGRPRTLPSTVHRVAGALRDGAVVAVFPEGTTWCGTVGNGCRGGGPFRPAMFQAAIDAGVPVVPVRVSYRFSGTGVETSVPAFLGTESLLRSVRRVLVAPALELTVAAATALYPEPGADRRRLAEAARAATGPHARAGARRPCAPIMDGWRPTSTSTSAMSPTTTP